MKHLNQFITEYIVKKKLDKPIYSEDHYDYYPKSRNDLINNIRELISKDIYDFNCIDTSVIKDMTSLFDPNNYNKPLDNIDISKWNVSNVKYMQFMFDGYENFNCDLSKWDVSNVENMEYMFENCKKFNCDLSNWDVSNVEYMSCMFKYCKNFEGKGLENWNVGNVTDMSSMFEKCKKLDCNLSNWDVHNVISIKYMFFSCENFDCDLSNWNVSNVKNMMGMFYNCNSLKNTPDWYKE